MQRFTISSMFLLLAVAYPPALHGQTWDSRSQFSGVQGQNGWLYRTYRQNTNTFVNDLTWNGSQWEGPGSIFGTHWSFQTIDVFHPGTTDNGTISRQIVRSWQAPG